MLSDTPPKKYINIYLICKYLFYFLECEGLEVLEELLRCSSAVEPVAVVDDREQGGQALVVALECLIKKTTLNKKQISRLIYIYIYTGK